VRREGKGGGRRPAEKKKKGDAAAKAIRRGKKPGTKSLSNPGEEKGGAEKAKFLPKWGPPPSRHSSSFKTRGEGGASFSFGPGKEIEEGNWASPKQREGCHPRVLFGYACSRKEKGNGRGSIVALSLSARARERRRRKIKKGGRKERDSGGKCEKGRMGNDASPSLLKKKKKKREEKGSKG